MTHAKYPIPVLPKASQPPLSHHGATPDSERAKKPALAEPPHTDQKLGPGDRVEELGNFGKLTGELGTVKQANDDDAVVKWDGRRSSETRPAVAQEALENLVLAAVSLNLHHREIAGALLVSSR